jgi:hypothetical protein
MHFMHTRIAASRAFYFVAAHLPGGSNMCVAYGGRSWERHYFAGHDTASIQEQFQNVDVAALEVAMFQNGFQPLTTDMVLASAVLSAAEIPTTGIRLVPFHKNESAVYRPDMKSGSHVIDYMEQAPIAQDMWLRVSKYTREAYGLEFRFLRKCACTVVPIDLIDSNKWFEYERAFYENRAPFFGATYVSDGKHIWKQIDLALASMIANIRLSA